MKLHEMREILRARGIQLTRSLGQNFLHDANQLRKIELAADVQPGDSVLEIGPGLGPLTEVLLQKAGHVLALEKDHRLIPILEERFGENAKFELRQADALEWLKESPRDWSAWKLVANLPYSVASPILVELAMASEGPVRMAVTLQWEVVRRIVAGPGTPDYGLLSLLLQLSYEPGEWFKIPSGCFFPEPDIDSGFLVMNRRVSPLLDPGLHAAFVRVVKTSFSQRRKMMMKLLRAEWPGGTLSAGFERAGIPADARAEQVSLAQFATLVRTLETK